VDGGAYLAVALIAALTAGWTFFVPTRAKRIQRSLASRKRSPISLADGTVKLTGRLHRESEILQAPLSGRACVIYEIVVAISVNTGSGQIWRYLLDRHEGCSFLVADDSGTARIDTSGPYELALAPDLIGTTSGSYPGTHRALSELLESNGIKPTNWLGRWRAIRYAEGVLEPGALVSVGGVGTWEGDPMGERDSPRSMPRRLVLRGTESQPLLIGEGTPDS
jgi:hypothetical protein